MYYSEKLKSPVSESFVRERYGVDPQSAQAKAVGIYPLAAAPAGRTPIGYTKQGEQYQATVLPFDDKVLHTIDKMAALVRRLAPEWQDGTVYKAGDLVSHNGQVYCKADDGDNSEPGDVEGGWDAL